MLIIEGLLLHTKIRRWSLQSWQLDVDIIFELLNWNISLGLHLVPDSIILLLNNRISLQN